MSVKSLKAYLVLALMCASAEAWANDGYTGGYHATGISNDTVYLNDLEDHTWTYYSGVDASVDGGYYNTNYKGLMYSPNPRNVKITYRGGGVVGASAVAVSGLSTEQQNCFVYYITLEKNRIEMTGDYPYHIIPNPFSKRPAVQVSTDSTTYYGFAGWKVISGANYILREDSSQAQINDTLNLEEFVHFNNLGSDDSNTPMAEVVLEATWTQANVYIGTTAPTSTTFPSTGKYETNFWVVNGNVTLPTLNIPCTITMVSPDGTTLDYRSSCSISGAITVNASFSNTVKIEWINKSGSVAVTANGKNLFIGRGVPTWSRYSTIYGASSSNNVDQIVRIESGAYRNIYNYTPGTSAMSSFNKQIIILGCDYDRAKQDNTQLDISSACCLASAGTIGIADKTKFMSQLYLKSGDIVSSVRTGGNANASELYYFGMDNYARDVANRYVEVQGGTISGICGGASHEATLFFIRMKGGEIRNSIYGGAAYGYSEGNRIYIMTGGIIKGWVAGGANGTKSDGGLLVGATYIYVGGNTTIGSKTTTSKTIISHGSSGNVYAAGCGVSTTCTSGEVTDGTNLVVADNAFIEHGAYGGGSYGYTTATSNIYITGGTVAGRYGARNGSGHFDDSIPGGVFGGACLNKGGSVNIYMTGGTVGTGIFGGSNSSGTLSGNVKIKCIGGKVGSSTAKANIHGGGYGASTAITGNVSVSIGTEPSSTDKTANKDSISKLTIYGDVYGGSALGQTNTGSNKTTEVKMYSGTVNGDVYGGALGSTSAYATVGATSQTVDIYGGKVTGGVYGGSNINANLTATTKPQLGVTIHDTYTPTIAGEYAIGNVFGGGNGTTAVASGQPGAHDTNANGTFVTVEKGSIGNVFGGGNSATVKKTTIDINTCDAVIGNTFGGGNAAAVEGDVTTTIWGGTIGNAFGGGNGTVHAADVNGNSSLTIHGGTITNVFAGSNTSGTISGTMALNIDQQTKPGCSQCTQHIDSIYGGGNKAEGKGATITIGCGAGYLGNVFGGAKAAKINGKLVLNINGGQIDNVFGGNDQSGEITDSIIVNINNGDCASAYIGNVYGGGNQAPFDHNTQVNLISGKVGYMKNGALVGGNVFGGGYGARATVSGNTEVNLKSDPVNHPDSLFKVLGSIYGGGEMASVQGNTTLNLTKGTAAGVFGGGYGEQTNVDGNVDVTLNGTTITGDVYGGSALGNVNSDANDYTHVTLTNGSVTGNIYGGGLGQQADTTVTPAIPAIAAKVYGPVTVALNGGTLTGNAFGGNNRNGAPQSTVNVELNSTQTAAVVTGNMYGGGNQAAYTGNPTVQVTAGKIDGSVFGGGYGSTAIVTGDTQVSVSNGSTVTGSVFGGGNAANVKGGTNVKITGTTTKVDGSVFGGGNEANVSGPTYVQVGGH